MPGFPCSQLQQTVSHSQGQGKCLGSLAHSCNRLCHTVRVRGNAWVPLLTVATDCVTQSGSEEMPGFPCSQLQQTVSHSQGQGKCLGSLAHSCNRLCHTVRVRGNAWVPLLTVATDCVTQSGSEEMPGFPCSQLQQTVSHSQGQGKCLGSLAHSCNRLCHTVRVTGFPCSQLQQTVSHSQGQRKCLGSLAHSCNRLCHTVRVRGNAWVPLLTVAADCVTQSGSEEMPGSLAHSCNRLCHTVRVRGNAWVPLLTVATDCVTQGQGKCLGSLAHSCNRLCHTVRVRGNAWVHLFTDGMLGCPTVRLGKMSGCTCSQLRQTMSHIEVSRNAWVHLFTVATDCVTQ